MGRPLLSMSAIVLALAGAAACTPTRQYHGYVADNPDQPLAVQVGVDTKTTVQQRLGSPSTQSTLDGAAAWYYVSSTQERFAFYRNETVERKVTAIRFDANDTVSGVDTYGLERGRVISYNSNETPTRGRELGIIEQIFGNIGATSPIRVDEDENQPGRRR